MWLRIGSSGGLLWLAGWLLAFQEELCSMELVSYWQEVIGRAVSWHRWCLWWYSVLHSDDALTDLRQANQCHELENEQGKGSVQRVTNVQAVCWQQWHRCGSQHHAFILGYVKCKKLLDSRKRVPRTFIFVCWQQWPISSQTFYIHPLYKISSKSLQSKPIRFKQYTQSVWFCNFYSKTENV
jgi:hypothetical protein